MTHPTTAAPRPPVRYSAVAPLRQPPLFLVLVLVLVLVLPVRASAVESGTIARTNNKNESTRATAASADVFLSSALAAESRGDAATALRLFQQADRARPNDPAILQKISRQYSDLSDDLADPAEKQRALTSALAAAQRAVALGPRSAVNVLSVAICYGKLALLADARTKVAYARAIRGYAERATALDPDYALAHYVLGRWLYEVADAGATKRFFARLLYGGLPPASLADALHELRRATALDPQSPANHTALGLALLADGQPVAARAEFARAVALPARDKHDAAALRQARAALDRAKED